MKRGPSLQTGLNLTGSKKRTAFQNECEKSFGIKEDALVIGHVGRF
ncbi:hypothetical protein PO124_11440 [Bacillus licheniformis]|nr:hypothetical protein [Bacillus licheniformis]